MTDVVVLVGELASGTWREAGVGAVVMHAYQEIKGAQSL